jgi:tungstate transport system substrate-binding protein
MDNVVIGSSRRQTLCGETHRVSPPFPALSRRAVICLVVTALGVCALASCHRGLPPQLVLATTTSVGNAGLLEVLTPLFEQEHGVRFGVHLAGSGRALQMLATGDADVVISHAPEAEARAMRQHPDWWYRKIMFNDFLLVGAPSDPAGVRTATSLDDALRRIAGSEAGFVSRADESGTHERERTLWASAGATPAHSLPTGQGMAMTLRIASERGGYTLTDRATWMQLADALSLVAVAEGDARLLNTYAVIVGSGTRQPEAMAFARWLVDGAGRERISMVTGFTAWPQGHPATNPADLPGRPVR